jgi:uncharacterized membrane protein YbhN (UPF0104 family)
MSSPLHGRWTFPGFDSVRAPRLPPWLKIVGEHVLVYAFALGVVWYESRGMSPAKEVRDLADANLWLLFAATGLSFLIWLFGENLIFARMFTHFHEDTGFWEVFPATAAAYFLQVVNSLVANGPLMIFLHRRKRVGWLTAGFTMAFFGFLDGLTFPPLMLLAALLGPPTPLSPYWLYYAAAFALMMLIGAWWMWRTPRLGFEKWLHDRPSLVSFREANLSIYGELLLLRLLVLAPQGFLIWAVFKAFHLSIPLGNVLAITPALLATTGAPLTPGGLGPVQAIAVHAFSQYAPQAKVMAASLSFSLANLLYRLPLGLGSASFFVSRVLHTGGNPEKAHPQKRRTRRRRHRRH